MMAITIMTIWNIVLAIGIIIMDTNIMKKNKRLEEEKQFWMISARQNSERRYEQIKQIEKLEKKINNQRKQLRNLQKKINNQKKQLRNLQKKSIVRERTIETENTI